jgi:hypothetical protein
MPANARTRGAGDDPKDAPLEAAATMGDAAAAGVCTAGVSAGAEEEASTVTTAAGASLNAEGAGAEDSNDAEADAWAYVTGGVNDRVAEKPPWKTA